MELWRKTDTPCYQGECLYCFGGNKELLFIENQRTVIMLCKEVLISVFVDKCSYTFD